MPQVWQCVLLYFFTVRHLFIGPCNIMYLCVICKTIMYVYVDFIYFAKQAYVYMNMCVYKI